MRVQRLLIFATVTMFIFILSACNQVDNNNNDEENQNNHIEAEEENENNENENNVENDDDYERTFYYMPDSNNNDNEVNEVNEANEANENEDEEEDSSNEQLNEIIDEIKYISKEYEKIHRESWTIVGADFKRYVIDDEHAYIMDDAYVDYDELAYHAEIAKERVKDYDVKNKESLISYLENIKEASEAKGYASMYYSYMISDALSGYAESPSDEDAMYDYLFQADDYEEKALDSLEKFKESNEIEI